PLPPLPPSPYTTLFRSQRFADCAASVQQVLEETLVDIARALRRETDLPDLCLGGGVALNGVANARILAESGFERVSALAMSTSRSEEHTSELQSLTNLL